MELLFHLASLDFGHGLAEKEDQLISGTKRLEMEGGRSSVYTVGRLSR